MKSFEDICPQCGRGTSKFSKENYGVCNGCKDRNKVRKNEF